ncbi:MAG: peptidylprolyl isomerase [Rhodothermales bacterium]
MKRNLFTLALLFVTFAACQNGNSQSGSTAAGDQQLFSVDGDFAGSHILVAYSGAMRANPSVTRTKEEAMAKADSLIAVLKANPDRFDDLAREESDGPSGPSGGNLGAWKRGMMVQEFDDAIAGMDIGAITETPVETAFGYHVIRRNSLEAPFYGADAFFVGFASPQSPPEVTRTQEEARALVEGLKSKVNGANFEEMGAEYNDFGDEPFFFIGGFKEDDNVPPQLLEALKGVAIGEVAGPVEFPSGYAFVRRTRLERRSGAHILVPYAGAQQADPSLTRTKEEALARANEIIGILKDDPTQFAALASENPDMTGSQGGDLGLWFKGSMVPTFEDAISDLEIGEITETPIETDFGYHIIMRKDPIR